MLWLFLLPLGITLLSLIALVVGMTMFAARKRRKPVLTFFVVSFFSIVAFIPSFIAVNTVVDYFRFGVFKYQTYSQVRNFRIERYLPPNARSITLRKEASGHQAKYTISEKELVAYLDQLWKKDDGNSIVSRKGLNDGTGAFEEDFITAFKDLGWRPTGQMVRYFSPVKANWAGAKYFYDRSTGTAYHDAGYW